MRAWSSTLLLLCACSNNGNAKPDGRAGDAHVASDVALVDVGVDVAPDAMHNRFKRVVTGFRHTCVLLDDGNVRCWGASAQGQTGLGFQTIGDNEPASSATNVDIGGTAVKITAGHSHTCALLDTGNLRCWGDSSYGQLGYGNTNTIGDNETPASAGDVPVGGKVVDVVGGNSTTCALLDTGNVRCWGLGIAGWLGYGNTNTIGDDETPASAGDVDVGGTVVEIVAGGIHTCVRLTTGAVRCWGESRQGQLGYGNLTAIGDNETPAAAGDVPLGGTATQLAVGNNHTCALLTTGNVRCWGWGLFGRLGYGNTADVGDNETPASVGDVPIGGKVVSISGDMESEHTCAVLDTGAVRCWGYNVRGQLGYGHTNDIGDDETPASAGDVAIGATVFQVASGGYHTCALLQDQVMCWGKGDEGALGYGNTNDIGDNETPMTAGFVPVL